MSNLYDVYDIMSGEAARDQIGAATALEMVLEYDQIMQTRISFNSRANALYQNLYARTEGALLALVEEILDSCFCVDFYMPIPEECRGAISRLRALAETEQLSEAIPEALPSAQKKSRRI